jgi:hypothetical protein
MKWLPRQAPVIGGLTLIFALVWDSPNRAESQPSLIVSADRIDSRGPEGGPFSPTSFQFRVSASSGTIRYSIRGPAWLTITPAAGETDARGMKVTFTVSPAALRLAPGTYGPAVSFTNVNNGQGSTTRAARLTISPPAKSPPRRGSSVPERADHLLEDKGGRLLDDRGEPLRPR